MAMRFLVMMLLWGCGDNAATPDAGDFGCPCDMRGVAQPTCETPSMQVGWCVDSVCLPKCDQSTGTPQCKVGEPITKDPSDPADCYCQ